MYFVGQIIMADKYQNPRTFRTNSDLDKQIEEIRKVEGQKVYKDPGKVLSFGEAMRKIIREKYQELEK